MHVGRSYKFGEFLFWTRRKAYILLVWSIVPVLLYETAGLKWINIPWAVVALLGTATAFTIGFKNVQTYNRMGEAQQVWTTITGLSRVWGLFSRDLFRNPSFTKELIYRHLAWLTALRYDMRSHRPWETTGRKHNEEYQRFYHITEKEIPLDTALANYLSDAELKEVINSTNTAARILGNQSKALRKLYDAEEIPVTEFFEMERGIKELLVQQARSEQIKNAPYPRQYAIINRFFIRLFCITLPFGLLKDFDSLNELMSGMMKGHMVWLVVPFSILISWMYASLEQVGESTENPFEGSANDVPISQISRNIEIELRELLGEENALPATLPQNNIIL